MNASGFPSSRVAATPTSETTRARRRTPRRARQLRPSKSRCKASLSGRRMRSSKVGSFIAVPAAAAGEAAGGYLRRRRARVHVPGRPAQTHDHDGDVVRLLLVALEIREVTQDGIADLAGR